MSVPDRIDDIPHGETVCELTEEQRRIRTKYAKLKPWGNADGAQCFWPMLKIDQQSFFIGDAREEREEAVWVCDMLARALERMIAQESAANG